MLNLTQDSRWPGTPDRTGQASLLLAVDVLDVQKFLLARYLGAGVYFVGVDEVLVRKIQGKRDLHDQFEVIKFTRSMVDREELCLYGSTCTDVTCKVYLRLFVPYLKHEIR